MWHTRQLGCIEAVRFGTGACCVFVQKGDRLLGGICIVLILNHARHMAQGNALIHVEEVNQIVVVRGEQSAALQVSQKVDNRCSNGGAIICGSAASQLIEQH